MMILTKRPPETLKKTQTLTSREKPKEREIYINLDVSTVSVMDPTSRRLISPSRSAAKHQRMRRRREERISQLTDVPRGAVSCKPGETTHRHR
jgi:hypothetical protein